MALDHRTISYHEAGHATCRVALGLPFSRVVLIGEVAPGKPAGSVLDCRQPGELREDADREAREAVSIAAGPLAQAALVRVPVQHVLEALGGHEDAAEAWRAAQAAQIPWNATWELAARFVTGSWTWIENVAADLQELRALTPAEVAALRG